jgi:hypothetical protein
VEGFKSRPLYATLAVRDLRIDNRLYLVLQTPIEGRQQVIVTATNLDGDSAPSTHFLRRRWTYRSHSSNDPEFKRMKNKSNKKDRRHENPDR